MCILFNSKHLYSYNILNEIVYSFLEINNDEKN